MIYLLSSGAICTRQLKRGDKKGIQKGSKARVKINNKLFSLVGDSRIDHSQEIEVLLAAEGEDTMSLSLAVVLALDLEMQTDKQQ